MKKLILILLILSFMTIPGYAWTQGDEKDPPNWVLVVIRSIVRSEYILGKMREYKELVSQEDRDSEVNRNNRQDLMDDMVLHIYERIK